MATNSRSRLSVGKINLSTLPYILNTHDDSDNFFLNYYFYTCVLLEMVKYSVFKKNASPNS